MTLTLGPSSYYPPHLMTYVPAKFELLRLSLGEDAFTRKDII